MPINILHGDVYEIRVIARTVEKQPMLLLELDLNTRRSRSFTEKMSTPPLLSRLPAGPAVSQRRIPASERWYSRHHAYPGLLRSETLLLPALQTTQSKILLHDSKRRATLEPDTPANSTGTCGWIYFAPESGCTSKILWD